MAANFSLKNNFWVALPFCCAFVVGLSLSASLGVMVHVQI